MNNIKGPDTKTYHKNNIIRMVWHMLVLEGKGLWLQLRQWELLSEEKGNRKISETFIDLSGYWLDRYVNTQIFIELYEGWVLHCISTIYGYMLIYLANIAHLSSAYI
jgi:hypothetical protein